MTSSKSLLLFTLLLIYLSISHVALGQGEEHEYRINGTVVQKKDGKPKDEVLVMAFIVIRDASGEIVSYEINDSKQQTVSNKKGKFVLNLSGDHEHAIFSSKDGFTSEPYVLKPKSVSNDEVISIEIALEKGESNVFNGTFLEKDTEIRIDEVNVELLNITNGLRRSVITNANGDFHCILDQEGKYVIKGYKIGYLNYEMDRVFDDPADNRAPKRFDMSKIKAGETARITVPVFEIVQPKLTALGQKHLEGLIKYMESYPSLRIKFRCHSDARGSKQRNLIRTQNQARVLREYLVSKGISASRIEVEGVGEKELLNECGDGVLCTSAMHDENRRVEYTIY